MEHLLQILGRSKWPFLSHNMYLSTNCTHANPKDKCNMHRWIVITNQWTSQNVRCTIYAISDILPQVNSQHKSNIFNNFQYFCPPQLNIRLRARTGTLMDLLSRAAVRCSHMPMCRTMNRPIFLFHYSPLQKGFCRYMNISCNGDIWLPLWNCDPKPLLPRVAST